MAGIAEKEPKAYTYTLFVDGQKPEEEVSVTGRIPREFLVSVGSEWQGNSVASFKDMAANLPNLVGAGAQTYVAVEGNNKMISVFANKQWSGAQALTFNLVADFVAEDNAVEDVLKPTLLLQSMAMPSMAFDPNKLIESVNIPGGLIGPSYWSERSEANQVGGKSNIKLRFGELFLFDDMVVESVALNYDMRLVYPGVPSKISAEIQVSTRGILSFEQYIEYMTGSAVQEAFAGTGRLSSLRNSGSGTTTSTSGLEQTAPTR